MKLTDKQKILINKVSEVNADCRDTPLKDFLDDDEIYDCLEMLEMFYDQFKKEQ